MTGGRRPPRSAPPERDSDLEGALDAMTVEELRAFVLDVLDSQDDAPRRVLVDSLLARAAKGRSGWKPSGPSGRVVAEVKRFVQAARRIGYADPADVEAYLRQGSRAFLAGDHATARGVFDALLSAVADAEFDLGQHEMVDEVLTVDAHQYAAQYVVSVYTTTPPEERAGAVMAALETVRGLASFLAPLEEMQRTATGPLPEFDAFLPRWAQHLEREPPSDDEWEGGRDHWIREAVLRLEGVAGLERIARQTKKPDALRAWCETLVARREWAEALRAYDEATRLARKSEWRGAFLDGAALAARELRRPDAAERLQAAWLGAPSLVRLVRWLGADDPTVRVVVKRAKEAMARCPTKGARQLGLLHLLTGDVHAAARLLAKAPGLGWSSEDHPGHILFPAFAGLLAEGTRTTLSAELFASLQEGPHDPWDMDWDDRDHEEPRLSTPSIAEIIGRVRPVPHVDSRGRAAMLDAMRTAATKRVEGILGNKRRGHYGHVALLIACCLELAPGVGKQGVVAAWVSDLRKRYSRFHAFQKECTRALASISV